MNWKEYAKKYGIWIAGFALVGYLLYRNARGSSARPLIQPAAPGAAGFSADQYRLETERLRQAGALDLERLRLNSQLEAERLRQAQQKYNIDAQLEAQRRALGAQQRNQTLGAIGQIANSIAGLLKGQQTQSRPSTSTPPTFPSGGGSVGGRTQPQLPPAYSIPEPAVSVFFDPNYVPAWPAPPTEYPLPVTDWGEAPQFGQTGLSFDSGATYNDQAYAMTYGSDYQYVGDIYSQTPQLGPDYGPNAGVPVEQYYDEYQFYGFDFAPPYTPDYETPQQYGFGGTQGGGYVEPGYDEYEFYGFDFG